MTEERWQYTCPKCGQGGAGPPNMTYKCHRPKCDGIMKHSHNGTILKTRLCDEDCNHCPIIMHPNYRLVTLILNEALETFGNDFYGIVQKHCPNMTVCAECRIDDFCHVEDCTIMKELK